MRIRCIDLETTGFEPSDHVVEIAAFDLLFEDGKPSKVLPVSERLVRPPVSIPAEASSIHHIIDADVTDAPSWSETFPDFLDDTVDAYAAHKADFEKQWLPATAVRNRPWICTWRCALRVWPDAPSHSNQGLRYWLKPPGLDRSMAPMGHRAGPDAYCTAFILDELFKRPKVEINGLIKCSMLPAVLPTIKFGKHKGKKFADLPTDYLEWMLKQEFDEDAKFTAEHHLHQRRKANA